MGIDDVVRRGFSDVLKKGFELREVLEKEEGGMELREDGTRIRAVEPI